MRIGVSMLHMILLILKLIGIALLVILGLFVLTLCIVLFIPLKYQAKASAAGKIESVRARVDFSWLFHVVSGFVSYEKENLKWQVSILWKKINTVTSAKKVEIQMETALENEVKTVEEVIMEEKTVPEQRLDDETEAEMQNEVEVDESEVPKHTKKDKKRSTFPNICDKIKTLNEKKDKLEDFICDEVHKTALKKVKNELFCFLKRLKPKKFHLKLKFGFDDPSLTGKVLGAICMLYPIFEDNIDIEPDFENVVLEGETFLKGKFRCSYIFSMGLHLLLDKNVRSTVKEFLPENNKKRKIKKAS